MKLIKKNPTFSLVMCGLTIFFTSPAMAYLGPGAGLGMIGSLIAIVVVGLVIVLGLVVYPIRMLRKRKADSSSKEKDQNTVD
jgi:amino acid transporter